MMMLFTMTSQEQFPSLALRKWHNMYNTLDQFPELPTLARQLYHEIIDVDAAPFRCWSSLYFELRSAYVTPVSISSIYIEVICNM